MARSQQQFGGPWTREKLEILRHYLDAYTTALKNQPFDLVYVDAFAGTGYCEIQGNNADVFADYTTSETQAFLDGSARIALGIDEKPFDKFVFIEKDATKCRDLDKLRLDHSKRTIQIIPGDANEALRQWCQEQDWRKQRAVLFLDPFATQVKWETIQIVAETKSIDTWILFPVGAIQRMLPNDRSPDRIDVKWKDRLDVIFGSPDWCEAFYTKEVRQHLFGQEEVDHKIATAEVMLDYFIRRLGEVYAGVCNSYRVLKNSRNSPLFGFCFAVGNPKGADIAIRIAKHIVEKM